MRSTALKCIDLFFLFLREESWTRQAVAAELGMSPNAAFDYLKTMVKAGVLEESSDSAAHRYRLSESCKGRLQEMLGKGRRHDVAALIQARAREAERAVQVQLDHLRNELLEVLE